MNPDMQGQIVSTIITLSMENCILPPCKSAERSLKDLRLLMELANTYGRYVNIDMLMDAFCSKCKHREGSDHDAQGRCVVALVQMKNMGFFTRTSYGLHWKKTFYSKSNFRTIKPQ
ncbi:MAG: hypothetical protein P4M11_13185 [Candidatus Pacebacteria bacterium]|nr:hypothetical protein [Candidatus Paceibacterota bacterium]